ncbi:hypothetical protein C2845_PM09G12740 [Panicum miliaceum]|uniref:Uncharacterized protein n=1 Tax=Panicum miliaceum TaxID=4540 RepID=A0A3L6RZA5_PANMI|nr:hypothetical protein C2845_PM09G12740 [Panicum miliaceum]
MMLRVVRLEIEERAVPVAAVGLAREGLPPMKHKRHAASQGDDAGLRQAQRRRENHKRLTYTFPMFSNFGGWLEEAHGRCSVEESKQFQLNMLGNEIAEVEKALSGVKQPVRDYEYACFNPVTNGIVDYHTATPHVSDFTNYPG